MPAAQTTRQAKRWFIRARLASVMDHGSWIMEAAGTESSKAGALKRALYSTRMGIEDEE